MDDFDISDILPFFRFPVFIGHLPKSIGFTTKKAEKLPVKIGNRKAGAAVTRNSKAYTMVRTLTMVQNFKKVVCPSTDIYQISHPS